MIQKSQVLLLTALLFSYAVTLRIPTVHMADSIPAVAYSS